MIFCPWCEIGGIGLPLACAKCKPFIDRVREVHAQAKQMHGTVDGYAAAVDPWKALLSKAAAGWAGGYLAAARAMADPHAGHGEVLTINDQILLGAALADLVDAQSGVPA